MLLPDVNSKFHSHQQTINKKLFYENCSKFVQNKYSKTNKQTKSLVSAHFFLNVKKKLKYKEDCFAITPINYISIYIKIENIILVVKT